MEDAHFILSKNILNKQVQTLKDLDLKISYSYKTNREIGNILQETNPDVDFSIHAKEEIDMIKDKERISFFTQAETVEELEEFLDKGIKSFVIDNEIDLNNLLQATKSKNNKINLSIRMKFQEHRIGSGKYFVYGLPSEKVNKIIEEQKDNSLIENLGVHIHRKSQNTSEWEIKSEIEDSLKEESLKRINEINLGGGLPSKYKSYTTEVLPYIFEKLTNVKKYLEGYNIKTIIEPGRFLASPPIRLVTKIKQIQEKNIILNTTLYNCALDTLFTGTKMLVEEELEENEEGDYFLLKGNSPTRDDIFRYKVKLRSPKVGDSINFLGAGAYNYTTDFFGFKKLKTIITN